MKLKQQLEQLQHEEASFCPSYAHNSHQQQPQQQQHEGASFCPSGIPTSGEDAQRHHEGTHFSPLKVQSACNNINSIVKQFASVTNTSLLLLSQVMSYHAQVFKIVPPVGEAASAHHQNIQPTGDHDLEESNQGVDREACPKTTASFGEAAFAHHPCAKTTSAQDHRDSDRDPTGDTSVAHHHYSKLNQDGDPDAAAVIDEAISICRNPHIKKYSFRSPPAPGKSTHHSGTRTARVDALSARSESLDEMIRMTPITMFSLDPHDNEFHADYTVNDELSSFSPPRDEAAFAHHSGTQTTWADMGRDPSNNSGFSLSPIPIIDVPCAQEREDSDSHLGGNHESKLVDMGDYESNIALDDHATRILFFDIHTSDTSSRRYITPDQAEQIEYALETELIDHIKSEVRFILDHPMSTDAYFTHEHTLRLMGVINDD